MLAWRALEASGNPGDGFGLHRVLADRSRGLGLEILAEEVRLSRRHYFLRARKMGKLGELGVQFRPLKDVAHRSFGSCPVLFAPSDPAWLSCACPSRFVSEAGTAPPEPCKRQAERCAEAKSLLD